MAPSFEIFFLISILLRRCVFSTISASLSFSVSVEKKHNYMNVLESWAINEPSTLSTFLSVRLILGYINSMHLLSR